MRREIHDNSNDTSHSNMYIHLKFVQFWQNKYGFLRNKKHLLRLSKIQGDASRVQKLTVTEMAENQVTLT